MDDSFIGLKKDMGIPNAYPFKHKILDELVQEKEQMKEAKKQRQTQKKKHKEPKTSEDPDEGLEEVHVGSIVKEQEANPKADRALRQSHLEKKSRKEYLKDLQEVVEGCQVALEVLDVRAPLDSRVKDVESHLQSKGKHVFLILNKIDLVPLYSLSSINC